MDATLDIEEERRLLYVGITRARKQVVLSWARVRALYGREVYQVPSGFLREITPD
jgi:DNA helicase-2/ATP-dependent DNA helicase PcrA